MRVKIYQINSERDKNHVMFLGKKYLEQFQGSKNIDASIYDEVFNGELDTSNLSKIFRRINHEGHPLYRGHNLTVSDVVVMEDEAYFCEAVGFEKVTFNENLTQKPDNLIQVLYVEPHEVPYVAEIENTLEGQQRAVGGRIEYVYNDDNTIIVVNEEGKINGLAGNRRIEGDVLCGSFFIAGDNGENLCSLTEEQIQKYSEKFAKPQEISQEEIDAHSAFTIGMW